MNRKILIVAIAVLSVILLAGVLAVLILQNPNHGPVAQPTQAPTATYEEPQATVEQTPETTVPAATVEQVEDPMNPAEAPTNVDVDPDVILTTEPTEGAETEPTQKVEPTKPVENQKPTEPTEATIPELPTEPGTVVPETETLDYLKYHNMSGSEQAAFINTFPSVDAFFQWYNAAKKEYEDSLTEIDGDTTLDLGDLVGGN